VTATSLRAVAKTVLQTVMEGDVEAPISTSTSVGTPASYITFIQNAHWTRA
jgi:hypothetical protein